MQWVLKTVLDFRVLLQNYSISKFNQCVLHTHTLTHTLQGHLHKVAPKSQFLHLLGQQRSRDLLPV